MLLLCVGCAVRVLWVGLRGSARPSREQTAALRDRAMAALREAAVLRAGGSRPG